VWEWFFTADFDLRPNLPFESEMIAVKSAQSTNGLIDSAALEVSFGLQMDQEIENSRAF